MPRGLSKGLPTGLFIAMAASHASVERVSEAALDSDRFLAEAVDRCEGRHVSVRTRLGANFKLFFWDGPDGTRCRCAPLQPGAYIFVSTVVLSSDATRAVGKTNYLSAEQGLPMWVNVRSRLNKSGLLRPTWYVELPGPRRRLAHGQ